MFFVFLIPFFCSFPYLYSSLRLCSRVLLLLVLKLVSNISIVHADSCPLLHVPFTFFSSSSFISSHIFSFFCVGVYTSKSQWDPIMGSYSGGKNYPLWYARYDNKPNFSDFVSFGGWSKPAMKQYVGDTTLCGGGVDLNVW